MITIVLSPEAVEAGEDEDDEASVEIVVQKLGEEGSVEEELKLEGNLLDARDLAVKLSSEGNCVQLEAGPAVGEGAPSDGTSQVVVPAEGVPSATPVP